MTTKSRSTDEPDEETTPAQQGVEEEPPSAGGGEVGAEPLNPSGVPNQDPPNAEPDASVEAVNEAGGEQVQAVFDEANERGYFGETPDQDDRNRYTLRGQFENQ